MHVEIIHHPQCNLYKQIHKTFEDVIAEEGLPIPVETVEDKAHYNSPHVRIDGHFIFKVKKNNFEHIREIVQKKWAEINHFPRFTA